MKEHLLILGLGFVTLLVMPGSIMLLAYLISLITTIDLTTIIYSVTMTLVLSYALGFTIRRFKK